MKSEIDALREQLKALERAIQPLLVDSEKAAGETNAQIPLDLIEAFADKYAGTKSRWKKAGCTEADYLAYTRLKKWIEKMRKQS